MLSGINDNTASRVGRAQRDDGQRRTTLVKFGTPVLAIGLLLLTAPNARAQMQWTDKLFVNVNGGYQAASTDEFVSTADFSIYEEAASLTATQKLKSGAVFDGSVGYRLWKNLAVAIGFTRSSSKSDALVTARVPSPLAFDQLRVASVTASGTEHTQVTTHVQAVWFWPFTDKIDFAFAAGPSFIAVNQELISAVEIGPESGPPFTNPQITQVTVKKEKKTAPGFNLGADATYLVTKRFGARIGAGLTLRYVFASADLEGLNDSLKVGGFQVLAGVRIRY
jgi:hypothetical protein